jgi:hypothetical protein
MFREGVASKMRFGEQTQAGDTAATGKLVPLRGADWTEVQIENQRVE